MQAVVTFTGFETKKEGVSDHGPWALRIFKDPGGNKFQTFDRDLGDALIAKLNQQVTVTYEIESNSYTDRNGNARTAQNNVIKSFLDGAQAGVSGVQPQQTQTQGTTQSSGGSSTGGNYDSLNRVRAGELANGMVAALQIQNVDPSQMELFANMWLSYIETGSFTSSGSPSQPDGAVQQY